MPRGSRWSLRLSKELNNQIESFNSPSLEKVGSQRQGCSDREGTPATARVRPGLCFYYAATCCTVRPPLFCFLLSSRPEANAQKSTGKTLINKIYSAHLASCRTR
ncbi:unnamed protein product [Rangifer tarandus platyrhynchus]|uniref:Uncharacterized protein n=1 Tax=Rangifer tarandus platyrhynchus TaxID=3082113 RepID=A0ABN8XW16_RANTA|nr:unnamed protein product [Rangifer tarandus platyrhynchus]